MEDYKKMSKLPVFLSCLVPEPPHNPPHAHEQTHVCRTELLFAIHSLKISVIRQPCAEYRQAAGGERKILCNDRSVTHGHPENIHQSMKTDLLTEHLPQRHESIRNITIKLNLYGSSYKQSLQSALMGQIKENL